MLTFIKGMETKFVSEGSTLIEKLTAMGWVEKTEEKEIKNGKSGKSSN